MHHRRVDILMGNPLILFRLAEGGDEGFPQQPESGYTFSRKLCTTFCGNKMILSDFPFVRNELKLWIRDSWRSLDIKYLAFGSQSMGRKGLKAALCLTLFLALVSCNSADRSEKSKSENGNKKTFGKYCSSSTRNNCEQIISKSMHHS